MDCSPTKRLSRAVLTVFAVLLLTACAQTGRETPGNTAQKLDSDYFGIHFVDASTGRGVPLVEAETNHGLRYVSDSAGWIAIHPNDIDSETLYLHLTSHGYSAAENSNGFRGVSAQIVPGTFKRVKMQRSILAERLYRVTGEGIYRDTRLLGLPPPVQFAEHPPGGVFGQDSVLNALYDNKLYWFWGDTKRGNGPLGNFYASGATSTHPQDKRVDVNQGIRLQYYTDRQGFTRAMCPLEGKGVVWLSGLMSFEQDGEERMFAHYGRWKKLGERLESGIAEWDDKSARFVKQRAFPLDAPLHPRGHPLQRTLSGETWFQFGYVLPNIRVRAQREAILDPASYEAFTCLQPGNQWNEASPPLHRDKDGNLVCDWKAHTGTIEPDQWEQLIERGLVQADAYHGRLTDAATGKVVIPHRGSVNWNEYLQRWILIANEVGGSSYLGEVWYAEADEPMGPWTNVRKIASHQNYSFYNVKQHPYYASGHYVYFEGTYTRSFSSTAQSTPRYDYNQIMYRLDLSNPQLRATGPSGHPGAD